MEILLVFEGENGHESDFVCLLGVRWDNVIYSL